MNTYKTLATAVVVFAGVFSFAGEDSFESHSNPLLFKPAFELTQKDQVLLDILHHDKIQNAREDFNTLEEINGQYPSEYETAYSKFQESLAGKRKTRESYLDAVTNAAEYLYAVLCPKENVPDCCKKKPALSRSSDHFVSLLIGINYRHTRNELQNCIHDIEHMMEQLLKPKLGLKQSQMIVMSDYKYGSDLYPTKRNILKQFENFVVRANQTKEAFLHYSGHGSYTWDSSGDELDRKDEVLCPVDCATNGMISDDVVFEQLVKKLHPDVKLTAVTDCCHSGTIMDLPYRWFSDGNYSVEQKLSSEEKQSLPNIVMLSGCDDTQTSSDGGYIAGSSKGAGAMTAAFLETLKDYNYVITYRQLLQGVHDRLRRGGFTQKPQLSSTYYLDLDDYFMTHQTALRP